MFGNFFHRLHDRVAEQVGDEILPPRVRLRWLLMTVRLSDRSAWRGLARTLVAVGTSSDADMFFTTAAAAPRRTWAPPPSAGGAAFVSDFGSAALGLAGVGSALAGADSDLACDGSALAGAASVLAIVAPLPAGLGAGAGPGSGGAVGADGCPSPASIDVPVVGSGE